MLRTLIILLTMGCFLSAPVAAQQAGPEAELVVLTRADSSVYINHNAVIPLSHGYNVYRQIGSEEWELLTSTPLYPVQNGFDLENNLGDLFEFISDEMGIDDAQRVFLSLRSSTGQNLVIHSAVPEIALQLGRAFIDEEAPVGSQVSYRFEIVDDLGRPTGQLIQGLANLTPQKPVPPKNVLAQHSSSTVTLEWYYPTRDESPETKDVIRFKTFYKDLQSGFVTDATNAVLVRRVGESEFRKYIKVPYLNREYDFWVEAFDYSGQSSGKSETIRLMIEDNVPPPIISNVEADVNENYQGVIIWPVSTELDLVG